MDKSSLWVACAPELKRSRKNWKKFYKFMIQNDWILMLSVAYRCKNALQRLGVGLHLPCPWRRAGVRGWRRTQLLAPPQPLPPSPATAAETGTTRRWSGAHSGDGGVWGGGRWRPVFGGWDWRLWRHRRQIAGRAAAVEPPLRPPLPSEKGSMRLSFFSLS